MEVCILEISVGKINRNEILKYLQYRGNEIPYEIDEMIDGCIEEVEKISQPRYTLQHFDLKRENQDILLDGTNFYLPGEDIKRLLEESDRCVMIAATLGVGVDKMLRMYKIKDLTRSVVMDSVASAAIESVIGKINDELEEHYKIEGLYLTDRFSPGYGDMDISVQPDFLRLLEAQKNIGLNVSSSGIMTPRKSVTAIVGISDKPQEKRFGGCEVCSLFKDCSFRKKGLLCARA